MEWAIETQALGRTFGTVVALDGLDLRVARGSTFGFLGPNGAGKTTTLHLLLGLLPPTAGTARVCGLDVSRSGPEVRRRCGALLEHVGLYERLTAHENLVFFAEAYGLEGGRARDASRAALEGIGLWDRRGDKVGTWSKGMKQRLAIARALVHEPEVLFLDEPTNGFDAAAAAALRDELARLARERALTVFLTTHNLHEAEQMCKEVAVLRAGRLIARGRPAELVRQQPVLTIEADGVTPGMLAGLRGLAGVERVDQEDGLLRVRMDALGRGHDVVARLVHAGARVHEARRERTTLEDAFVRLLEAP